jgi:hypothetical protein
MIEKRNHFQLPISCLITTTVAAHGIKSINATRNDRADA